MISFYKRYPIAEQPNAGPKLCRNYCIVWTGEKRCPKKGEWFLSGSYIEGYRAFADMTTPYHIGKLVRKDQRDS